MSPRSPRTAAPFPGTVQAPLELSALLRSAEVVCQGEVLSVLDGRRRRTARFRADLAYKGTVRGRIIEIEFDAPNMPSSLETVESGEYVILFLRRAGEKFLFAHATTSKVPVPRGLSAKLTGAATPRERLRRALIECLPARDARIRDVAAEQLGKLGDRRSIPSLRRLARSGNARRRAVALSALLRLGDRASAAEAVSLATSAAGKRLETATRMDLLSAISEFRGSVPLQSLRRLAQDSDPEARYTAVRVIRQKRTRSARSLLFAFLRDQDLQTRYQAFMALVEVSRGRTKGCTLAEFRSRERECIAAVSREEGR